MTDALSTYRGHTVVLVTHAAPSKMILTTALNVDPAVAYRMRVDTASLSGFTVEADGARHGVGDQRDRAPGLSRPPVDGPRVAGLTSTVARPGGRS